MTIEAKTEEVKASKKTKRRSASFNMEALMDEQHVCLDMTSPHSSNWISRMGAALRKNNPTHKPCLTIEEVDAILKGKRHP